MPTTKCSHLDSHPNRCWCARPENSRGCNTWISQSFEHKGGSGDVQVVADVAGHWTGFAMTSLQGGIRGTGRAADRRLENKRPKIVNRSLAGSLASRLALGEIRTRAAR